MMPKESWEEQNKSYEILTTDKIQREKITMQVDGKKVRKVRREDSLR